MQTHLLSINTRCFSSIFFIIIVLKFHIHSNTNMINILKYKISTYVPRVRVQFKTNNKKRKRITPNKHELLLLEWNRNPFSIRFRKELRIKPGVPRPSSQPVFSLEDYKTRYPLESEAIYSKPVLGNSSVLLYTDTQPVQLIPSLLFLHT